MDRDRRHFISTALSLRPGEAYDLHSYQHIYESEEDPVKVSLTFNQQEMVQFYFSNANKIDLRNRERNQGLNLEHKFQTKEWSMRKLDSIFVSPLSTLANCG